jgi:hypothetical protein
MELTEILREMTRHRAIALADLLDQLANGETVALGEFGDAATDTDADEQSMILREIADELRKATRT